MGNIVLLDDLTINKIAAGEVIERPASAVKELVENSIDAGATNITIEIKNGGISYMRITDNGKGILPDDMEIAFERHATSKIRVAQDIETVKSMGFRGEALASIAAISRVTMKSKTEQNYTGSQIIIEGGSVIAKGEIGCPNGTSITIENLFYNTPVRYKFLKKDFTEAGYIEDAITRIALAHPEIAIRYINTGKTIISTSGNGDIKAVIYAIYGKDIAENIINVDYEYENIKITGVVGKPEIARSNRSNQLFFVNKRYIKDKILTVASEEAFKNLIPAGKYGFLILNIELSPAKVDVNVHPAKLEVRFQEEQNVFKAVYNAMKNALENFDTIRQGMQREFPKEFPKENKNWEIGTNYNSYQNNKNEIQNYESEEPKGFFKKLLSRKEKVEEPTIVEQVYQKRKQEFSNNDEYANSFNAIMEKMTEMQKRVREFKESEEAEIKTKEENVNENKITENKIAEDKITEDKITEDKIAEDNATEEKKGNLSNNHLEIAEEQTEYQLERKEESYYMPPTVNQDKEQGENQNKNQQDNNQGENQNKNQQDNNQGENQNKNQQDNNQGENRNENQQDNHQAGNQNENQQDNNQAGNQNENQQDNNQAGNQNESQQDNQTENQTYYQVENRSENQGINQIEGSTVVNNENSAAIRNELQEKNIEENIGKNIEKNVEKNIEENIEKNIDENTERKQKETQEQPKVSYQENNFEEMYASIFGTKPRTINQAKQEPETYTIPATQDVTTENLSLFEPTDENTTPKYNYIGIAFNNFIVIEKEKELYILDQISAKEKIIYEKLKQEYQNDQKHEPQMMLLPDVINVTPKQMLIAEDNKETFEKVGFALEQFGQNTIKLSGVPSICMELDTEELFLEILEQINKVARTDKQAIEEKFIETIASKIAKNSTLASTPQEVEQLMKQLLKLPNALTQEPEKQAVMRMTKADIEKKFSRR